MQKRFRSPFLAAGLAAALFAGCGSDSSENIVSGANPAPPDSQAVVRAPRALHDYVWLQDGASVSFPLLDNDDLHGAVISQKPSTDQEHGTVSITEDGVLTYTPKAHVLGQATSNQTSSENYTHTFEYTLTNSVGSSTATVSVSAPPAVYINNTSPAGGDGSQKRPYNTLLEAVQAANGAPRRFLVEVGNGLPDGLGDNIVLASGQAIVGQSSGSDVPFLTGRVTMADNTALLNLLLGVVDPEGGILATNASALQLQNLTLADGGSLGPAISFTGCSQINLTDLLIACQGDAARFLNASGQLALQRVALDQVGGGLVFDGSQPNGTLEIDLDNVSSERCDQPLKITLEGGAASLYSSNCALGGDASKALSVDLRGRSSLNANLAGWKIPATTKSNTWVDFTTEGTAQSVLKLEHWSSVNLGFVDGPHHIIRPDIANSINFTSKENALAAIVVYECGFYSSNPLNALALDDSKMYVRVQNYPHNLETYAPDVPEDYVPVNISGRDRAQTFIRMYNNKIPDGFSVGIVPVFDFRDSSLATVVRLFGFKHISGPYPSDGSLWTSDNIASPIKLNGNIYHGGGLKAITSLPHFVSVLQDNIGIPTP